MTRVAALYIDQRGPYPKMGGVDCWDAARDARTYAGPWPVVAHPPCGPWGSLRHLSRKDDPQLALIAVDQVRRFGGVLKHPAGSKIFDALKLPRPGELPDEFGGYTIEVCQVDWGQWSIDVLAHEPVMIAPGRPGLHERLSAPSIVSGPAARGLDHSTVWQHGKLFHDPHPSRAGLISVMDLCVFVPLRPEASHG